jgi:hypothetical protein
LEKVSAVPVVNCDISTLLQELATVNIVDKTGEVLKVTHHHLAQSRVVEKEDNHVEIFF